MGKQQVAPKLIGNDVADSQFCARGDGAIVGFPQSFVGTGAEINRNEKLLIIVH
jgi:hypothetical protein